MWLVGWGQFPHPCKEAPKTHWFPRENSGSIMPQLVIGTSEGGVHFAVWFLLQGRNLVINRNGISREHSWRDPMGWDLGLNQIDKRTQDKHQHSGPAPISSLSTAAATPEGHSSHRAFPSRMDHTLNPSAKIMPPSLRLLPAGHLVRPWEQ